MGYVLPEEGFCEVCGLCLLLYPVQEDEAPTHCRECLEYLQARTEALYDAKLSEQ